MKKLFILGGNGDIGKAIVQEFVQNNYEVLSPTSTELNLENNESIENYLSKINSDIDVLINCAGYNSPKPVEELSIEDINKTMSINTLGFYNIVKYFIPNFKDTRDGYILGISSLYGTFSRKNRLAYATSKHALNGMIKSLALELGVYNVKVNALSPGFVDTKLTRKNNDENAIRNLESKIPLGNLALPEDIAKIAYFLCSEENKYINGQDIVADGGYSIGGFQN